MDSIASSSDIYRRYQQQLYRTRVEESAKHHVCFIVIINDNMTKSNGGKKVYGFCFSFYEINYLAVEERKKEKQLLTPLHLRQWMSLV